MKPPISEATRLKMRNAKLGSTPWNKGKPFTQMLGNQHASRGDRAKKNTGNRRAQTIFSATKPCADCGETKERFQMIRHHIDGNTLNNTASNIEFLCRSCHIKEHRADLVRGQRLKAKVKL